MISREVAEVLLQKYVWMFGGLLDDLMAYAEFQVYVQVTR